MSVNQVNQTTGALSPIAGGTLYAAEPIGSVKIWMSNTIPNGYLLCNGQAISKTTYADLYAVIGSTFGETDTTFNVPDLRGEFLRGAGTNSHTNQGSGGVVGAHQDATTVPYVSNRAEGNTVITEQVAPTGGNRANVVNPDSSYNITTNSVYGSYQAALTSTSAAQQLTVRPTNTSVNYIIKATTIALPSDFEAAVDEKIAVVDGRVTTVSNKTPKQLQNGSISANDWALLSLRIQDRVINSSYFTVTVDLNQPYIFYIAKNNAYMFGVQAPVTFSNGTITLGSSDYSQFGSAQVNTGTSPALLAIYGLVHK